MFKKNLITISIAAGLLCCNAVLALPEGGDVVAGGATIQQPSNTTLTVNQSTDKAIINWNQFNIGTHELTQFNVPANTSVTLNRVIGGSASQILGTLKSNGQLWLINPNGVVFGPDSQVNVAGIVANNQALISTLSGASTSSAGFGVTMVLFRTCQVGMMFAKPLTLTQIPNAANGWQALINVSAVF